jgi:hypothetical protein
MTLLEHDPHPEQLAPDPVGENGVASGTRRRPPVGLFLVSLVVYLAGGAWLIFVGESLMGDAVSRVANGYFVLFSRDPHLAAVGFVWSPLPSLAVLPLLPLEFAVPALVTSGYVGCVQSAVFMAGAVYQMRRYFDDLGVQRLHALVLTTLFAFNPMIAYYGMNGMSEASFLFFCIAGTRYLSQWVTTERSNALALSGGALGLAYLSRYEAGAAGFAAIALVGLITYVRHSPARGGQHRGSVTLANTIIIALPFLFAVVLWAAASWLIVGSPFAQFTSEYGNSAQTEQHAEFIASLAKPPGLLGLALYTSRQLVALAPFAALIAGVCGVLALRRRDIRPAVPVVVLGSTLVFTFAAFLIGQTFGWLRFSIAVIPLVWLLAGSTLANLSPRPAPLRSRGPRSAAPGAPWRLHLSQVAIVSIVALGLPLTASSLFDPYLGREESYFLKPALQPGDTSEEQAGAILRLRRDRQVADYLDELGLPEGSVLIDAANGFGIILSSSRPRQFVITSDRDFREAVADPYGSGVQYLITRTRQFGGADAIMSAHPDIFDGTSDVARPERVFEGRGEDLESWHLFRVLEPS